MEKLIDLIRQLDTGDIALPNMQRDYVWRPPKVEKLLDSLYKRWPVGSFYLWCPSKKQPKKDHHPGEPVKYLLDGQQRLASLSRAIKGAGDDILLPRPGRKASQAISWRAFFDVVNETFILKGHKKSIEGRIDRMDPALIALSDVIQADDQTGIRVMSNITEAVRRLVEGGHIKDTDAAKNQIRVKLECVRLMLNAEVLCHTIHTLDLASTASEEVVVAIEIFRRLNSGGVNLSAGDVAAAQLAQETTASILGPMRAFAGQKACVALGLNFTFLTRALAAIRHGSARFSKLPKNWAAGPPAIEKSWKDTGLALGVTTDIVQQMGWTSRRWLPSTSALLPVAYFAHRNGGRISKDDEPDVVRFLCLAAWAGAFSGASETAIDYYLRKLAKGAPGNAAGVLTRAIPRAKLRKVTQDDILYEPKMTGTLMQIYSAYLVAHQAKSWPSGQLLADAGKNAGGLDVHHIFPRRFVEHIEADLDVNTMSNYAILTQEDNAVLADEDPKVAYGRLTIDQKRLASRQFIPFGDDEALLPDAYEAFTRRRAREMAKALNEFMGL